MTQRDFVDDHQGLDAPASASLPRDPEATESLYSVIRRRRDVRGQFTGDPVDPEILTRVLGAAHAAPSVGLTQPWDFLVVTSDTTRRAFAHHVGEERRAFAEDLDERSTGRFAGIKIDGVLESSLSIVVTYDASRGAPHVIGRRTIADAGLYSVCLAIENLWLACTAEGWGLGWVSFYREPFVAELLGIPSAIRPVAWLCAGPVTFLHGTPDLERAGWRERVALADVVRHDQWAVPADFVGRRDAPVLGGAVSSDVTHRR